MKDLIFDFNYNNKLNCNAFTAIQPKDPSIKVGDEFKIILKPINAPIVKGVARVQSVRHFKFEQLNEFMAFIETGYSLDQTTKIFQRKHAKENIYEMEFSIILFVYINGAPDK